MAVAGLAALPRGRALLGRILAAVTGDLRSLGDDRCAAARLPRAESRRRSAVSTFHAVVTRDGALRTRELAEVPRDRSALARVARELPGLVAMGTLAAAALHADLRSLGGGHVHLSSFLLEVTALLAMAAAVLGTERLGRPLTDEEKKRFGALLLEHDYSGQRLVAFAFAFKLTRNRVRAQDLMGRADLRLVRFGWDPAEVPLKKRLCRLVWSEWTNEASETEAARKAEQAFLQELEGTNGWKVVPAVTRDASEPKGQPEGASHVAVPSHEQTAVSREVERAVATKAAVKLEKLRVLFERAGDEVNLLWLRYMLADVVDLQKMAVASGRPVEDFYAAAKRRKRAVQRLLANDRGVEWKDEDML